MSEDKDCCDQPSALHAGLLPGLGLTSMETMGYFSTKLL
jgi:hypothetical protein